MRYPKCAKWLTRWKWHTNRDNAHDTHDMAKIKKELGRQGRVITHMAWPRWNHCINKKTYPNPLLQCTLEDMECEGWMQVCATQESIMWLKHYNKHMMGYFIAHKIFFNSIQPKIPNVKIPTQLQIPGYSLGTNVMKHRTRKDPHMTTKWRCNTRENALIRTEGIDKWCKVTKCTPRHRLRQYEWRNWIKMHWNIKNPKLSWN